MQLVKRRTHASRDADVIGELTSAQDWCWNRVASGSSNILKVDDTELTMAAQTSSYDLATNVSTTKTLIAIKWLGVKLSSETKFTPVIFLDSSDDRMIYADQDTAATVQPIYCSIENFGQVRFAPPLPSGTIIRCDYIYAPTDLSLASNASPDLPILVHNAIADKATAQIFINLDDDRAGYWEGQSIAKLYSAINVLNRRQFQQQPRTRPSVRYSPYTVR